TPSLADQKFGPIKQSLQISRHHHDTSRSHDPCSKRSHFARFVRVRSGTLTQSAGEVSSRYRMERVKEFTQRKRCSSQERAAREWGRQRWSRSRSGKSRAERSSADLLQAFFETRAISDIEARRAARALGFRGFKRADHARGSADDEGVFGKFLA